MSQTESTHSHRPLPDSSQALLTVSEAAALFGHSTTWVRNRIADLSLEAKARPSGPTVVTFASVLELRSLLAAREEEARTSRRRQPRLRLVVDNT